MKAFTKILLISGGALVVLGFGVTALAAAIGGGFNGTVFNGQTEKYDIVNYDFSDDINNITIKESSHDIQIGKSSDSNTHVTVYDNENHKHTVSVNGDSLEISVNLKDQLKKWYQNVTVSFGINEGPKVIVLLPEDEYQDLTINASSSDVNTDAALTFGNTTVKLSSGNIMFNSKVTENADIKTTSGDIRIDDMDPANLSVVASSGNITLMNIDNASISTSTSSGGTYLSDIRGTRIQTEVSSGDIKLTNIDVTENIKLSSTSGEIILDNVSADSLDSVSSSGDFIFTDLALASESSIKTSSGDVSGKSSSFLVLTSTNSGDINVDQVKEGTTLNVSTSSGDICVR